MNFDPEAINGAGLNCKRHLSCVQLLHSRVGTARAGKIVCGGSPIRSGRRSLDLLAWLAGSPLVDRRRGEIQTSVLIADRWLLVLVSTGYEERARESWAGWDLDWSWSQELETQHEAHSFTPNARARTTA